MNIGEFICGIVILVSGVYMLINNVFGVGILYSILGVLILIPSSWVRKIKEILEYQL